MTTYKVINRSILWRRSRRCNVIDSLCDIDPILSIASHYGAELLLILSDDEALENPSVRHSLRDIVITFTPSMNISTICYTFFLLYIKKKPNQLYSLYYSTVKNCDYFIRKLDRMQHADISEANFVLHYLL